MSIIGLSASGESSYDGIKGVAYGSLLAPSPLLSYFPFLDSGILEASRL